MKIYTKTGDKGQTSLLSGQRVDKNYLGIEIYGTIDELNSFTGLLRSHLQNTEFEKELEYIQHKLFNAGTPFAVIGKINFNIPEIVENDILFLESKIDRMNAELPELRNFILPGGNTTASLSHVCRSICRRAERNAVSFQNQTPQTQTVIKFLNRLSDYFFVLARKLSSESNNEIIYRQH